MSKAQQLLELVTTEDRRIVRTAVKPVEKQADYNAVLNKIEALRTTLSKEDKQFLADYVASGSLALDKDKTTVFRKLFKDKGAAKDMADQMLKFNVKPAVQREPVQVPDVDSFNPETDAHLLTSELLNRLMAARPDGVPLSVIDRWAHEVLVMNAIGDEYPLGGGRLLDLEAEEYPFLGKVWDKMHKDYAGQFQKDKAHSERR